MTLKEIGVHRLCMDASDPNVYYVFTKNSELYRYNDQSRALQPLAKFPAIATEYINPLRRQAAEEFSEDPPKPATQIDMHVYGEYVSIVQTYGLTSAVYNLRTGRALEFTREDYCAEVSQYSNAFLMLNGHTVYLHQTRWNRLDGYDLVEDRLLTEREIDSGDRQRGILSKNYFDYFHGSLQLSPDESHFLDNGWHWNPDATIYVFDVREFMNSYEGIRAALRSDWQCFYNWERPCAFIDDDTIVTAQDLCDDNANEGEFDASKYEQLHFYRISDRVACPHSPWTLTDAENRYALDYRKGDYEIHPYKTLNIRLFDIAGVEGEVFGDLFYLSAQNTLVALMKDKVRTLRLDSLHLAQRELPDALDYRFSAEHQRFYRYDAQRGCVDVQTFVD